MCRLLAAVMLLGVLACDGGRESRPISAEVAEGSADSVGETALTAVPLLEARRKALALAASRSAEEPSRSTVHGRVVDMRSGEGVPGCLVRLLEPEHREDTTTDEAGCFSFPRRSHALGSSVWVRPAVGWRWVRGMSFEGAELTPDQRAGQEPFVCEVARRRKGTILGVALDAATGKPLPYLRFMVVSKMAQPGRVEEVETDAFGGFRTQGEFRGGLVTIQAVKGEPTPRNAYHDELIEETWTLEFHAGPLFEVRLTGAAAPSPTRLNFWILREGEPRFRTSSRLRRDSFGGLWARPPAPAPALQRGNAVVYAVGDDEGHLFGTVSAVWGEVADAPLVFELSETAAFHVEAEVEPSEDTISRAWRSRPNIALAPLEPPDSLPSFAWRSRNRHWLSPGTYDLRVSTRNHAPAVKRVELEPGLTKRVHVSLKLAERTRTVRGRLRSEAGGELQGMLVTLRLRDGSGSTWSADYARQRACGNGVDHFVELGEEEGREVGRFTFENVPAGPVEVRAHCWSLPTDVSVRKDASGDLEVDVLQLDAVGGPGFGFRLELADPEREPRAYVHTRVLDDGPELHPRVEDGRILSRSSPSERRLEWAVVASGCRPVFGTADDFLLEEPGRYFAPVRLEPGWGTRVRVVDGIGDPIGGASVLVDGEPVGTTDSAGTLPVERESEPGRIEVEFLHWEPAEDFPPVETNPSRGGPWHEVVLVPPAQR